MGKKGDVLQNAPIGHELTILESTQDSNGQLFKVEYVIHPGGIETPYHTHRKMGEVMEVVSGKLGVRIGTKDNVKTLSAGEKAEAPPRVPHQFWNAGEGDVKFIFEMRPPGRMETWYENYFGMAKDGKIKPNGTPKNFFQFAPLAVISDTYLVGIPVILQRIGLWIGTVIVWPFGTRSTYKKYSG